MKSIFEEVMERQVKHEALKWFKMEDAKEIEVHAPRFIGMGEDGGELHFNVVVVYRPAVKEPYEVALLDVIVKEWGIYVASEKRTRDLVEFE